MMESPDMKQSIEFGVDNMQQMQMSGDIDKDFAMMKMYCHHALDISEIQLAHGKSQDLKAMKNKIIFGSEEKSCPVRLLA